MNARILVKSANVDIRKVTRSGKPDLIFREQQAALETGNDFPQPFRLTLDDDQPPYPPGDYTLDLASCRIGDYGRLALGRIKLAPLTVAKPTLAKTA